MRHGFTTGSCAAAAAKAAAWMLLLETEKETITIQTPKGILYEPQILDIKRTDHFVSCAVEKDAGDDPDVTGGAWIYAKVEKVYDEDADAFSDEQVIIEGGKGVGRVTKPGLDQPVGNAAINRVPREMICKEVEEVCRLADHKEKLRVTIFVPGGEELAEKTFNPRLGIVGGISIIGTSGVVEPMSNQALLDTIRVELRQRRALAFSYVAVTPGNYGRDYMKRSWNYDLERSVKCSNFIGDTLDMAVELGFEKLLLTGHIGKLIKVSGGIMNTHSSQGDCRMELLSAAALRCGVEATVVRKILDCVVTEEALRLLADAGKLDDVMAEVMKRIMFYLQKRADGKLQDGKFQDRKFQDRKLQIECVMYSNDFGELARSEGAESWLTLLAQEQAQQI